MSDYGNPLLESPEADDRVVNYIRSQRHDFMNEIQVIWGYLQIGKPEEALRYITGMKESMDLYGRIFYLDNPTLSLFLYDHITRVQRLGLSVDFSSDIEKVRREAFASCYHEKIDIMDSLFQKVSDKCAETGATLYIDIYVEDGGLYIVFANNADAGSIDLQEDWNFMADKSAAGISDSAEMAKVKSMCRIDGEKIAAAICFEYREDD